MRALNSTAWRNTRQQCTETRQRGAALGSSALELDGSALELDGSVQSLLTRAVTLGRLQTVSEGLSGGRQLLGNCRPLSIDQTVRLAD
ncbi:UNVERIFIED_CONTAM: hypothetical protein Sradi_5439500 [Sesamum radiatum]|uniref:Uncharacterized protein n=1 Tax=Sesamum radiatum TaxID=300843 RepID=A0AAW2L9U0_SESRA